jgi:heat shock protein HslJ
MLRPVPPGKVALPLVLMLSAALTGCSSKSGPSSSSSGSGSGATASSGASNSGSTSSGAMSETSKSGSAPKTASGGAAAASKSASGSSTGSSASAKVQGAEWRIAEIGGQDVSTQSNATLKLGTDGHVSGSSGCNQFNGKATLSGHSLHFGPMASTRKACEPALMSQEARLFKDLGMVTGYTVDEKGDLHLTDAAGNSLMRLERATP